MEEWRSQIKINTRNARVCSLLILFLLIITMGFAIFVIALSLYESNVGVIFPIPIWLRILGVTLNVLLMFRGELWPAHRLSELYNDARLGHRFYPQSALKLIQKNYTEETRERLRKIVYKYEHNFANPQLTDPDHFLDQMSEEICQQLDQDLASSR